MYKKVFSLFLLLLTFSIGSIAQVKKVALLPVIDKLNQVSYAHNLLLRSNITTAIALTEGYEAYDRIDLSSVLDEQDFQRKGLVSDSDIHKIGELTGADYVIIAEAAKLDDGHLIASAKIVNVESAKIEKSAQAIVDISDLEQMSKDCQTLTSKLLGMSEAHTTEASYPPANTTQTEEQNIPSYQPSVREGFVDMGLSVKWAECNLGASSPEQYGEYYAWGEISFKSVYSKKTYEYHYNPSILPLSCDVANVKLGGTCRMPTYEEWNDLRTRCKWTWMAYKGVFGYKVEASNGNSIFLPAAGFRGGDSLVEPGVSGSYWTSSRRFSGIPPLMAAVFIATSSSFVQFFYSYRHQGLSVRPVSE